MSVEQAEGMSTGRLQNDASPSLADHSGLLTLGGGQAR